MRIIVIGLGSMGKRRIRLIREAFPDYSIYGIDARDDRRTEAEKSFSIETFSSIEAVGFKVDCAFVCTSPLSHAAIIEYCLKNKMHVFTELNLTSEGYTENMGLSKENNCTLFLSSTFLYREEIKEIKSRIIATKKWNYVYHVGQYLPDWHPWENYNDFFIGDKRTNGCREILAIEFPWLIETFGNVSELSAVSDKMSTLDIGFDDNYMIQVNHENGNKGILVVDVVSPVAVRRFEAYAEEEYLSWNGTTDSLFEFDPTTKELKPITLKEIPMYEKGYSSFVVENAYKNEVIDFFDVILNGSIPKYSFEKDLYIIKLIDSLGV